ncbi:helix-turn-helix domain-containing protein [Microbacterium hydrocarbonoxydans]|uniref:helix-turn-helix domain-containing protein n=1 Tax=Microbacterium hydrocarbonoxydans TaxID=273678 RepID=UPI001F245BC0|nr:helix-turn-helix domain-containing protein [Microbacterium hydrocarbonoxydans]
MSYGQVAARYGVSKTLVHKLHHRWLTEGDAAYEPRSRRPGSTPNRTPERVRDRALQLRDELTANGLDAGADTITEHLAREGILLSRTTIWRILKAAGRVTTQPQKRPRSSWRRSPPTARTSSGSPTSPTSPSPMAPTSRSSAGSTTTPAACCT